MSDNIRNTAVAVNTIGTSTAYTVPTGKAFRGTFMYYGVAGTNSTLAIIFNGCALFTSAALTAANAAWSTSLLALNTGAASGVDGSSTAKIVAPYTGAGTVAPFSQFLGAGQTCQYAIATANFTSLYFAVVGSEVDAT